MSEVNADVGPCAGCGGSGKAGIVPKDWTTGWEGEPEDCPVCNATGKVSKQES
jgi:hypothetical protein